MTPNQEWNLDAVCLGPRKTATTWLHYHLAKHPQLILPDPKETFFFDRFFYRGVDWYRSHFSYESTSDMCLEIAPSYFSSNAVRERLYEHNPRSKLIVIYRHPIDRAFSLYRHHVQRGRIQIGFESALVKHKDLILTGLYSDELPRWENRFSNVEIKFISFEDIQNRPEDVLKAVEKYLEVTPISRDPNELRRKINVTRKPRNTTLALVAARVARWAREYRLDPIINIAKACGLKTLLHGDKEQSRRMTDTQRTVAAKVLDEELRYVQQRFDIYRN